MEETISAHKRIWNLETLILGILGAALCWQSHIVHNLNVIEETIILVVFLGALMGVTRIPFPQSFFGKPLPLWSYPAISGIISGFMDSFLVLLMVGAMPIVGQWKNKIRFQAYNMMAALIGGLITYFGEVYMLPLALKYNLREWHSMGPLVVPVIVFLAILGILSSRLKITVGKTSQEKNNGLWNKVEGYIEFSVAIALLLVTKNAMLCLGILFVYAFIVGEGEDLIGVIKTETEMSVMMLLLIAWIIQHDLAPVVSQYSGYWAAIPSTINAVLTGAMFPVSGNFWFDATILSTCALLTPVSSLVGIMLFKTKKEWIEYMKVSIPLAILWFGLATNWFNLAKNPIEKYFEIPKISNSSQRH